MTEPPGWTPPDPSGRPGPPPGQWGPPQPQPGQWGPPQPPPGQWGGAHQRSDFRPPAPAYGMPYGYGYGAPKPGIVPLRPLGTGEILDGALSAIRQYPAAMLGLSAIVVTFSTVISLWGIRAFVSGQSDALESGDPELLISSAFATLFVTLLFSTVVDVFLSGALTVVFGEAVLGRHMSFGQAWQRLRPRLLPLLGLSVLSALAMSAALFFFVIPGVFLWVTFSFAAPALILERRSVMSAIGRSHQLVVRAFWRVFGILLLAWLIGVIVGAALQFPFNIAIDLSPFSGEEIGDLSVGALVILGIGQIVSSTIVKPFHAGVRVLLYVDRRMRTEGLDVSLAVAATQQPG